MSPPLDFLRDLKASPKRLWTVASIMLRATSALWPPVVVAKLMASGHSNPMQTSHTGLSLLVAEFAGSGGSSLAIGRFRARCVNLFSTRPTMSSASLNRSYFRQLHLFFLSP